MNWKKYEQEIYKYFSESYPETSIKYDQRILGKYSKVERQIDILIEGRIAGYILKIIVDCKYFSRKINVKEVESFASMIEDVGANQGILITQKGFSTAAINRAYYGPANLELDILNFDIIQKFQGFLAFPYADNYSVLLPAPFGWIIDIKENLTGLASLYQRGLTYQKALDKKEWMYINIEVLDSNKPLSIDDFIELQNDGIKQIDPHAVFEYKTDLKRKDNYDTKIRIATIKSYPAIEVTGFINFNKFIFFGVMFTPKELLERNLKKMYSLLSYCLPIEIRFDNSHAIEKMLKEIETTQLNNDKSDKYHQVGKWYIEMHDYQKAISYFKKSLECSPTNFAYLKHIIDFELKHKEENDAIQYSSFLLSIDPKNPAVPSCLIEIYLKDGKAKTLISFFEDKIKEYDDNEIKGNLYFHLGVLQINISQKDKAMKNFLSARDYFRKSLPNNHYVFKSINKLLHRN